MTSDRDGEKPVGPTMSDADWAAQGWSTEADALTAAPRLAATISIRLNPDDALLVRRAARLTGLTKSEFVRRATVRAAIEAVDQAETTPIVIDEVTLLSTRSLTSSAAQSIANGERPTTTAQSNGDDLGEKR